MNIPIQSLRGLAIILMVSGHVIGAGSGQGLQLPDDSPARFFYLMLEDLRMPLFAALSGFVYAYRPLRDLRGYPRLARGKARRLLVPLLTVGALFTVVQTLTPGVNRSGSFSDIWRVYIYGQGHFWFLQAIFLILLVVGLMDAFNVIGTVRRWSVVTLLSVLLFVFAQIPALLNVFSLSGAIRLLPFFLIGYGIHRFRELSTRASIIAAAVLLIGAYAVRLADIFAIVTIDGPLDRAFRVLVGVAVTSILLLIKDHISSSLLARVGYFAFGIYLLHVFGSAGARIALSRLGVGNELVLFAVALAFALGLPILFELTLGRVRWVSWAFLGQKPYRRGAVTRMFLPHREASPAVALPGNETTSPKGDSVGESR